MSQPFVHIQGIYDTLQIPVFIIINSKQGKTSNDGREGYWIDKKVKYKLNI